LPLGSWMHLARDLPVFPALRRRSAYLITDVAGFWDSRHTA
jgi:hypothetical protein